MNSRIQTNAWICRIAIVLGFIFVASMLRTVVLILGGQPLSGLLLALGAIAVAGLIQLFSSPLYRGI